MVMTLELLAQRASLHFARRYERPPRWLAVAPGRVNLIGEHTDYNNGYVLPMAIERYTIVAAAPAENSRIRIASGQSPEEAEFSASQTIDRGVPEWANYVKGVVAGFQRRGVPVPGLEAWVESTVPLGGGLASSAALEVASATLLEAVTGVVLEPVEKAMLCQQAEHTFAGLPCGIMDQFAVTLAREGHLLLIDCKTRGFDLVPMNDPGMGVLIINSNVKHKLVESAYAARRAQCEEVARVLGVDSLRELNAPALEAGRGGLDPVGYRRARHVLEENARTLQAAEAIRSGDWPVAGRLMYESHESLRDLYEVSCVELDFLVEQARQIGEGGGVLGSRMTGGGFGGCTVSLVRSSAVEGIGSRIRDQYHREFGLLPTVFLSRPARGAAMV
ncbi:MAG: galactokinase [Verrucomicrobia bacterium]|nr:galactokinase [Verrucomicrobiota bacterium]